MKNALLPLMGIVMSSLAFAAPVTWQAPANITGDSDVLANGEPVYAYNLGHPTTVTLNGVEFQSLHWRTGPQYGVSYTEGDVTLSPGTPESQLRASPVYDFDSAAYSALSPDYRVLLGSIVYPGPAGLIYLTLGGLTPGQTYQVQFWLNDARTNVEVTRDASTRINGGGNLSQPVRLKADGVKNPGNLGQTIVGTFTADAPTQSFVFEAQKLDNRGRPAFCYLNAFSLRRVTP